MTHERAWERLPDLLHSREQPELLAHVSGCHACQRQLFLLGRVDRLLRQARPHSRHLRHQSVLRRRSVSLLATLAAAAAAAVVLLLFLPRVPGAHRVVLRTADGRAVARATIARADQSNVEVSLVARGMTRGGGDQFLLWAQPDKGAGATPVGRFMVDRSGSCRAHFNLPTGQHWTRLWVTPASDPAQVVAST